MQTRDWYAVVSIPPENISKKKLCNVFKENRSAAYFFDQIYKYSAKGSSPANQNMLKPNTGTLKLFEFV